jgi:Protein of unknown function (DUF1091)
MNVTLHKVLDFKIMILFRIMKVDGKVKQKMFDIPKMNFCAWQRSGAAVPIISELLKVAAMYSNMVVRCPIKPGKYWAKDYPVRTLPIAPILPNGNYVITYHMMDENQKKAVVFMKVEYFVTKTF